MRVLHRVFRCASAIALVLVLGSCEILGLTMGGSGRRAELGRQRAKWASQQITSYNLVYRRDCFCGVEFTTPTYIEVRSGDIATARYAESDAPIPLWVQDRLPTVEALFDVIDDAIDREVDLLEVVYDPARGYPRSIAIDYRFSTADDEVTHVVSGLEIMLPPIVP